MPVTLAQAKLNAQDDLDMLVIDEFRAEVALQMGQKVKATRTKFRRDGGGGAVR